MDKVSVGAASSISDYFIRSSSSERYIGREKEAGPLPHDSLLPSPLSSLTSLILTLAATLQITSLGGLSLIIISHPHFYTTWADWSTTFRCPVYLARIDADIWANRTITSSSSSASHDAELKLLTQTHTEIFPGVTAIICGGHFDGSMVLHWERRLFLADTVFTVAVCIAYNPRPTSFYPFSVFYFEDLTLLGISKPHSSPLYTKHERQFLLLPLLDPELRAPGSGQHPPYLAGRSAL